MWPSVARAKRELFDATSGRKYKVDILPRGNDVDSPQDHITSKVVKSCVADLRARVVQGFKFDVGVNH